MPPSDPIDDFVTAAAGAMDLKVDPAWLPMVRIHLQVTLRHGASIAAFAMPDETEPAPVYAA